MPSAPSPSDHKNSLQITTSLLDSLVTYYEEERRWIEHIRFCLSSEQKRLTAGSQRRLGNIQQKEHLLGMFEKMIDTRLESCQRVSELLRQAESAK